MQQPGAAIQKLGNEATVSIGGNASIQSAGSGAWQVYATTRFPTVRLNANLNGGKWYYEIHLATGGIGRVLCSFVFVDSLVPPLG